jgi:ABC-type lipoprotein release transport system permease subunit
LTFTIAFLGLAALLACIIPARRASLLNPVDAIRAE